MSHCVVGVDPEPGLVFPDGPLLVLVGQQCVGQAKVSRGVIRIDLDRGLEFAESPLHVLLGKQSLAQADVGLRPEPVVGQALIGEELRARPGIR